MPRNVPYAHISTGEAERDGRFRTGREMRFAQSLQLTQRLTRRRWKREVQLRRVLARHLATILQLKRYRHLGCTANGPIRCQLLRDLEVAVGVTGEAQAMAEAEPRSLVVRLKPPVCPTRICISGWLWVAWGSM